MNKRINYLIEKLSQSFDGSPWYGDSVIKKLSRIDYKIANNLPIGCSNSIGRLVQHMANWRTLVIQKLKGNGDFAIEINGAFDWPHVVVNSEKAWEELVNNLKQSQMELVRALEVKSDEVLKEMVPNTEYNFLFLIEGIIRHDIYHLGQIALMNKMITFQNN